MALVFLSRVRRLRACQRPMGEGDRASSRPPAALSSFERNAGNTEDGFSPTGDNECSDLSLQRTFTGCSDSSRGPGKGLAPRGQHPLAGSSVDKGGWGVLSAGALQLWLGLRPPLGPAASQLSVEGGRGGRWGNELKQGQPPTLFFALCLIIKAIHTHCKIWKLQKCRQERIKIISYPTAQR